MSAKKSSCAESSEPVDVEPILSSDSQKDLADALDETPSAEDVKKAWVEENRRDLYKAFERGKKVDPVPQDRTVEVFNAVERTENDLCYVLVSILTLKRIILGANDADAQCRAWSTISMVLWQYMIKGLTIWLTIGW